MTSFRAAAASAALILMFAACGGDASTTESAAAADDSAEATPAGPTIEGSFPTVAGGQIDLGALAGQDTVLWFWAPW